MNEKAIFLHALELDSSQERSAFLEEACGGDEQLHKRIESMLRSSDKTEDGFRETPRIVHEYDIPDDVDNDADFGFLTPSDVPDSLGRLSYYEVVEFLGRGGAGIVFKAHDPKLNRFVAVKVLSPQLAANAMARKRFIREAHATAAISHPHVITIHAVDEHENIPFLVMEYIDGKTLARKMQDEGTLDLEAILRIGMQISQGLASAHAQGLIHRDIKPGNILLENGVERVKVADFGLARMVEDVSVTIPGSVCGTPTYMSPEQAQGETVDNRSDLFSLGSVLYAMCSGRSPFLANTPIAVIRSVCDETPHPIRSVNSDTPVWLAEIIDKLLAKNPDDRFQSALEVADLLASYLSKLSRLENLGELDLAAAIAEGCEMTSGPANDTGPPQVSSAKPTPTNFALRQRLILAGVMLLLITGFAGLELTGATHLLDLLQQEPNVDAEIFTETAVEDETVIESLSSQQGDEEPVVEEPVVEEPVVEERLLQARASLDGKIAEKDWEAAIPYAQRIVELAPAERYDWLNLGALSAWAGDEEAYLQCGEGLLAQFDDTEDGYDADVVCKLCLLRPDVFEASRLPREVLVAAAEATPTDYWLSGTSALVAYRAGDAQEAVQREQPVIDAPDDPPATALAHAVRAMAFHQLKDDERAQESLDAARALLEVADWHENSWRDWLIVEMLLREAQMLIDPSQVW